MTVVVLDANSMPRGQFSAEVLLSLRNLLGHGASIVIPEVVIWEWAEHARANAIATEEAIKQFRVDPGLLARPKSSPTPSAASLVESIESLLPHDVSVWRPSAEVWRDAVRDQVLQIGSGEVKSGVKTGAADATVLACLDDVFEHAVGAVVLLSADKPLRKSAKKIQPNVLTASGTRVLLQTLNTFTPDLNEVELNLWESLPAYLNERIADCGEALPFSNLGVTLNVAGEEYRADDNEMISIDVTKVDIVETHGFTVSADDEGRIGLANLRLFGQMRVEHAYRRESPAGDMVDREVFQFSNNFVDVTVAIRWNHNWMVENIVPTGIAVLVLPDDDESDGPDVPRFRAHHLKA